MYIYTQEGNIVMMDNLTCIISVKNLVVGVAHNLNRIEICKCENETDAKQLVQDIFVAIDHGKKVYYIGELTMPF